MKNEVDGLHQDSVLLVTLDSCRYDTFESASAPGMKQIGPLHRAMAPGSFTYSSHAAMFMGFTPGIAEVKELFLNPKYAKFFRMEGATKPLSNRDHMVLAGRNIVDGLKRKGYRALGTAAMGWFDPATETGRNLTGEFDEFLLKRNVRLQVAWILSHLKSCRVPAFVFLNVGEAHVPYCYEGAPWERSYNPCVPFGDSNDANECRRRQVACVEYVDQELAPLLEVFSSATVIVTADHGDCWGEDGLWEHGFHHQKVLEVPLLFRLGEHAVQAKSKSGSIR